jgi:Tol biopolymer transport system component
MRRTFLIAALALLLAAPAAHAFPGRNGLLAYGWSTLDEPDDGPFVYGDDIRTIATRGGDPTVVRECVRRPGKPDAGDCALSSWRDPSWSPDGTRIVFDGGARLALADADGGALRPLPAHGADDGEPVFSPGGTRLAFSTGQGARRDLWTSDLWGGGARRLVADGTSPSWSEKGVIAFARRGQVWTIRPDGSRLRQLTRGGGERPAFSPHGTKLAFLRRGVVTVMNADGSGLRTLTALRDAEQVRWSPDGRRLVLEQFELGISIANSDGTGLRTIVRDSVGGTYNYATGGVDWQPLR